MVKKDYINAIAEKLAEVDVKMTKKDIEAVLSAQSDVLLDVIAANDEVKVGEVVRIGGKHRDARTGRNPATQTVMDIPARDGWPYAKFTKVAKD